MGDFDPRELANTAWAFATAAQKESLLFAALATAAQNCMGDFHPQELANIARALTESAEGSLGGQSIPKIEILSFWGDMLFETLFLVDFCLLFDKINGEQHMEF